jgi:hypothetical protein
MRARTRSSGREPVGRLRAAADRHDRPSRCYGPEHNRGDDHFYWGAVAAGIGFQWGSGTLTYRGAQYPFSVRGVGVSRISATGTVRNLRNLADFSGNYVSATAGATVAGGAAVSALRNQNGVVIEGISTSQGARLTAAPGGVNITLTEQ